MPKPLILESAFIFLDYLLDVVISGKLINPFPLKIDSAVLTVTAYRFLDGVVSIMEGVEAINLFDVRSTAIGAFEFFCHFTFSFSFGNYSIAHSIEKVKHVFYFISRTWGWFRTFQPLKARFQLTPCFSFQTGEGKRNCCQSGHDSQLYFRVFGSHMFCYPTRSPKA